MADYLPDKLILNADEGLKWRVHNRSISAIGGITGPSALSGLSRDQILSPNESAAHAGLSAGGDSLRITSNKSGVSSPARVGTAESGNRGAAATAG